MNLDMRIPKDAIDSFADPRLNEIRKHVKNNPSQFPVYAENEEKLQKITGAAPRELQRIMDDLVDVMNGLSYDLQFACYLQGLADGGLTLSQLSQCAIVIEDDL